MNSGLRSWASAALPSLYPNVTLPAKVVTVLLTQNVPNYLSVLSRSETDSLLGNLATVNSVTRIFSVAG